MSYSQERRLERLRDVSSFYRRLRTYHGMEVGGMGPEERAAEEEIGEILSERRDKEKTRLEREMSAYIDRYGYG